MSLKRISELRQEMMKTIEEQGESALKEEFNSFFEAMPRLKAFRWAQYTPYFNDGDECTFRIGEPRFSVSDLNKDDEEETWEDEWQDDDDDGEELGFSEISSFRYAIERGEKHFNLPTSVEMSVMKGIVDIIEDNEDTLRYVFDDHQQITVYRDGKVTVEDYDHE